MDEKIIKEVVQAVVRELLKKGNPSEVQRDIEPKSGITLIRGGSVKTDPFPFDIGPAGKNVFVKDLVSLQESPRLGIGIMEMKETSFPWTLHYDEAEYIIEGTLEIKANGRTMRGNQGDVLYIPKNSSIEFSAPEYAKFLYVTYPADWAKQ